MKFIFLVLISSKTIHLTLHCADCSKTKQFPQQIKILLRFFLCAFFFCKLCSIAYIYFTNFKGLEFVNTRNFMTLKIVRNTTDLRTNTLEAMSKIE